MGRAMFMADLLIGLFELLFYCFPLVKFILLWELCRDIVAGNSGWGGGAI